jgi:uncharacterized protein YbjT (DUF2867 family)
MATYAGAVPAGSHLAFLQSIGAAGVSWTSYVSVFKRCSALCTASDLGYTIKRNNSWSIVKCK